MYLPGDQQNQKRNSSGDRLDPSELEEEGRLLGREKVWWSKAYKVEIVSSRSVSCWRCLDQSYFTDIKPSDQHNENINKNSRKKSGARIYYWNNRKAKVLHTTALNIQDLFLFRCLKHLCISRDIWKVGAPDCGQHQERKLNTGACCAAVKL